MKYQGGNILAGALFWGLVLWAGWAAFSDEGKPEPEDIYRTSIVESYDYEGYGAEQGTNCHPSYSGACLLPYVSDYDCAGGSGNGPYYTGTVRVVGYDAYGLDRDGNGWGCE